MTDPVEQHLKSSRRESTQRWYPQSIEHFECRDGFLPADGESVALFGGLLRAYQSHRTECEQRIAAEAFGH